MVFFQKLLLVLVVGIVCANILGLAISVATYKPYLISFCALALVGVGAYIGKILNRSIENRYS